MPKRGAANRHPQAVFYDGTDRAMASLSSRIGWTGSVYAAICDVVEGSPPMRGRRQRRQGCKEGGGLGTSRQNSGIFATVCPSANLQLHNIITYILPWSQMCTASTIIDRDASNLYMMASSFYPFIAMSMVVVVVVMVLAFPTSPQTFCNQRSDEQYNSPNMF